VGSSRCIDGSPVELETGSVYVSRNGYDVDHIDPMLDLWIGGVEVGKPGSKLGQAPNLPFDE
jgi:hypothetical protein